MKDTIKKALRYAAQIFVGNAAERAPEHFEVIGVDTFSNDGSWSEGWFDTLDAAEAHARKATQQGKQMLRMYIYDNQGKRVGEFGTF